jgi:hypothetical protein
MFLKLLMLQTLQLLLLFKGERFIAGIANSCRSCSLLLYYMWRGQQQRIHHHHLLPGLAIKKPTQKNPKTHLKKPLKMFFFVCIFNFFMTINKL